MLIIGITGGIASGKSLVARQLQSLGAYLIEADAIGHAVLAEPEVVAALVERWGGDVLDATGAIRRGAVAARVFAPPPEGPAELAFLERWTHPRIAARVEEQLQSAARSGRWPAAVLDAALLFKAGWHMLCDLVVFVDAEAGMRAARAAQRGWTDEQWRAREAAQPVLAHQRARADVVLDNSGTPQQLAAQVEAFWRNVTRANFPHLPFSKSAEEP